MEYRTKDIGVELASKVQRTESRDNWCDETISTMYHLNSWCWVWFTRHVWILWHCWTHSMSYVMTSFTNQKYVLYTVQYIHYKNISSEWGILLKLKRYSSPEQVISELQGVTCHMGSHSVTCHPTQGNLSHLTPARQTGTQFTQPAWMKGWVDPGGWLHTEMLPKINKPVYRVMLSMDNSLPVSEIS